MFSKILPTVAASLMLILLASAAAASQVIEIYPTGLYPDDVIRVQEALDKLSAQGLDGTLVLKARTEKGNVMAFNFGQDPDPTLRGHVEPSALHSGAIVFRGEITRDAQATILGGHYPIFTDRHDAITVEDIEFRAPYGGAIRVKESTGTLIRNNTILDTIGSDLPGAVTRPIGVGPSVAYTYGEIEGPVEVSGNAIVGASGWFVQGVAVNVTSNSVKVVNNRISGVNVGVQLSYYQSHVVLEGNELQVSVPRPDFFAAGIELSPGSDPNARALVQKNIIVARDKANIGYAAGISATSYLNGGVLSNSDFRNNLLELVNAGDGIDLGIIDATPAHHCIGNRVSRNRLSGTAAVGIWLYRDGDGGALFDNEIVHNMLSDLDTSAADILLGSETHDNFLIVNAADTVVDLGTNNTVIVQGVGAAAGF